MYIKMSQKELIFVGIISSGDEVYHHYLLEISLQQRSQSSYMYYSSLSLYSFSPKKHR